MKIAIYVVLCLVLAIGLVILIGSALPKKHVASRRLLLHRSPEEVFALISDFQSGSSWRRGVQQVMLQGADSGRVRFVEKGKNGAIAMEVRESIPPTRLVTEITDISLPFGGIWIFDISPAAQGCTLQITERGEIYNPFFRFVSRFILGYNDTLNAYLEDVGNHFREVPQIVDAEPAKL
jgi:hypothetical protein